MALPSGATRLQTLSMQWITAAAAASNHDSAIDVVTICLLLTLMQQGNLHPQKCKLAFLPHCRRDVSFLMCFCIFGHLHDGVFARPSFFLPPLSFLPPGDSHGRANVRAFCARGKTKSAETAESRKSRDSAPVSCLSERASETGKEASPTIRALRHVRVFYRMYWLVS
jgi:hypothetical protein